MQTPFSALQHLKPEGAHQFDAMATRDASATGGSSDLLETLQMLRSDDHPLSDAQITVLWQEAGVYGVVEKMDRADFWAVDAAVHHGGSLSPEVEIRLRQGLKTLSAAILSKNLAVQNRLQELDREVAHFLGHLRSSRALAAFRLLVDQAPGVAITLMQQGVSETSDRFVANLYDRVRVIERTRLLARVFSPERIATLLEILDDGSSPNSIV